MDARDENANESPNSEDPSSQSEPIIDTVNTNTSGSSDQMKESDKKDTNDNNETPPVNDVAFNTFIDSSDLNMNGKETLDFDTKIRVLESPHKTKFDHTTDNQNSTHSIIGKI